MNWGNGLVLVFVVFAALIGTLVYKSMHTKFELVSKDYYNEELRYQEKIDGKANAAKISKVIIVETADAMFIQLPVEQVKDSISGEAWFYCSSNAANDRKIRLVIADSNQQVINKKDLARTNYQLKLSWQVGAKNYYEERLITVH